MKNFLLLTLLSICSASLSAGSNPFYIISTDSPEAGQQVTFTLNDFSDDELPVCAAGISLGIDVESANDGFIERISLPNPQAFTYTFPSADTYTMSVSCEGSTNTTGVGFTFMGNFEFSLIVADAPPTAATAIPTLGEWGLIILSLIMLGIGMVYLGQRQRNTQGIS